MKSSLSFDELESHKYNEGDEVMYAHLQAADVKGYNRTATITKVRSDGSYDIRDEQGQTSHVDFTDIAPLSSRV